MTVDSRDTEFVEALVRERSMLRGTAVLLLDDPRTADDVLDATLAHLYARVPAAELRLEALRILVGERSQPALLPWRESTGFELRDGPPAALAAPVAVDLARLPRPARSALVLRHFTQLADDQIADLLGRHVGEVQHLIDGAEATLAVGHPERRLGDRLAAELRAALAPYEGSSHPPTADLAHGRRLVRRRRWRRSIAGAVAVLTLVGLGTQLGPRAVDAPAATPPVVTNIPSPRADCDTGSVDCQERLLRDWRTEMAAVASSHLDPSSKYDFSYALNDDETTANAGFWSGRGGALTLDLSQLNPGSTQVTLQLATTSDFALRCGRATGTTCFSHQFMDGNTVTLNGAPDSGRGLEVQFYHSGDEVVSVVARNTKPGAALSVTRGDLIKLVEDDRLRLPNR